MSNEVFRYDQEGQSPEKPREWGNPEVATELAEKTGGAITFSHQGRWTIGYNQGNLHGVGRLAEPYPILHPFLAINEPSEHGFSLEFHEPVFADGRVRFVAPLDHRKRTITAIEFKDGEFYEVEILRHRASDAIWDAQMIAHGKAEDFLNRRKFNYSSPQSPPKTLFKEN